MATHTHDMQEKILFWLTLTNLLLLFLWRIFYVKFIKVDYGLLSGYQCLLSFLSGRNGCT